MGCGAAAGHLCAPRGGRGRVRRGRRDEVSRLNAPGKARIGAGAFRGRSVVVPQGVRPTGGRVREALFSIWGDRVHGARFLDLFAGSGAVGLEALSRGADEVVLVEGDRRVFGALKRSAVGLAGEGWRLVRGQLPGELDRLAGAPFDLVFADPPYAFEDYERLLRGASTVVSPTGSLVIEHSSRVELPRAAGPVELVDTRSYGDASLTIFEGRGR